ncbi:MAG: DUF4139 domain-containing protein [Syntrophobacterales bacterium]|nr:DUF4139 domain-containing protein [Syntrophobacterales bacterium]
MKRSLLFITILWGISVMLGSAEATKVVESALLTPKSTTLWIREIVTAENGVISFDLPPQAIIETLNIKVLESQNVLVSAVSEEWLEERHEKELQELIERIKLLERERDTIRASQEIVKSEIEAWKEQSRKRYNQFHDVLSIIEEARKRLEELYRKSLEIDYNLKAKNEQLDQLNHRLKEMTGDKKKTRKVYCKLFGSLQDISKEITVRYGFAMKEAEWRPVYRLELFPLEKRLSFIWEAEINQRSGFEWSNVDLTLATSEPVKFLEPPELPPWIIEPLHRPLKKTLGMAPLASREAVEGEVQQPQLYEEEKGTFSIYHLGQHTIPSGRPIRLRLMKEDWNVQVRYLVRPFVSPWAFIQAKVNFDRPFQAPQGEGLFFLDGTFISKSTVSFHGLSGIFYFGTDPQVSSKLVMEEKQTGKRGFIRGKQTFLWKWYYEIENAHSFPVTLSFEERRPQLRDERIEIKFIELPALKALEECPPDRWCWEVSVDAREKKIFRFSIQAEAPEDMEILPGW